MRPGVDVGTDFLALRPGDFQPHRHGQHPITVGSEPVGIAITPDAKTTYVADYGSSTVTPITPAIGTPRPPIPVSPTPTPSPRSQPPQATPERRAPGTRRPPARCRPRPGELAARSGARPHRGGGEPGHVPDPHPCPAPPSAGPPPGRLVMPVRDPATTLAEITTAARAICPALPSGGACSSATPCGGISHPG